VVSLSSSRRFRRRVWWDQPLIASTLLFFVSAAAGDFLHASERHRRQPSPVLVVLPMNQERRTRSLIIG